MSAVCLFKVFSPATSFPVPFPDTSNLVISHCLDKLLPKPLKAVEPFSIASTMVSIIGAPFAKAPNNNNAPVAAALIGPGIPVKVSLKSLSPFTPAENTGRTSLPISIFNSVAAALACSIFLA